MFIRTTDVIIFTASIYEQVVEWGDIDHDLNFAQNDVIKI